MDSNSKHRLNLFINKAHNDFDDGNFDDAENILLQAMDICNDERVTSLLKQVHDAKTSVATEMPIEDVEMVEENIQNDIKNLPAQSYQKYVTLAEKETQMMINMFEMRVRILSMQINVAADRIQTHERYHRGYIVDNTKETERYRKKAERALRHEKFDEANTTLFKAEKLFSEMSCILFPVRVRKESNNDYVRMQKPVTTSNSHVVTAGVNKEEVVACLKKAETAFSGGDLEKAEKWLLKSLRMCPTQNAQEKLSKVRKAISEAEEAAKPDSNTDDNIKPNEDLSAQNVEQIDISNISEANKCFDAAKNALAEEDFDKSERLCLKAQRMNRSLDVNDFLKQIQSAKASRSSSEGTCRENLTNHTQGQPSAKLAKGPSENDLKEEAEVYLEIAKNALRDRDIGRAEQFISKSINCYPIKRAKELRKKIDAIKSSYNKKDSKPKVGRSFRSLVAESWKEKYGSNNTSEEIIEEEPSPEQLSNKYSKEEADTYLDVALNALKDKMIEKAEIFLFKSLDCCPTERANEVQKKIDDAKTAKLRFNEKSYQRQTYASKAKQQPRYESKEDLNKEIYEKYIDYAEDYIKNGFIEDAKRNALEAKRLCLRHNKKIERLLTEIYKAEKMKQRNRNNKLLKGTGDLKDIQSDDVKKRAAIDKVTLDKELQNEAAAYKNKTNASDSGNLTHADQLLNETLKLEPHDYDDGLLMQVQDKLRPKMTQSYHNDESHSKNEEASKGANSKIGDSEKLELLKRAQNAFDKGDLENATSILIIAENINSCELSRELYIKIVKDKHHKNVQYRDCREDQKYLCMAENAYIRGNLKKAVKFIQRSNQSSLYVRELQSKFVSLKEKQGSQGGVKFFVKMYDKVFERFSYN